MLIVEGADGSGKTTLVKKLSAELGWPVAPKVVNSDAQATVDLVEWVENNLNQGQQKMIFDRHRLISEPIYGPVLRGSMEPGFDDAWWLRRMQNQLRNLQPMVIFCIPPFEVVQQNIAGDSANLVVEHAISTIYWLYFNEAAKWDAGRDVVNRCYIWNYTAEQDMRLTPFEILMRNVKDWMWQEGLLR